jgi:glucokinase
MEFQYGTIMSEKVTLGIDIGGTNTVFGLVNQAGIIVCESSIKTKSYASAQLLIEAVYQKIQTQLEGKLLKGIGIGAPNANYFSGCIEFAPNLEWKGRIPLKEITEHIFHIETVITNDANAAALGEMMYGAARGMNDFVEITLGTGLGSGVIAGGKLIYGHDGLAGEFGHISIDRDGRICGCGRNGCLETYASSTGVIRSIELLGHPEKSKSTLITIENPTAKDVFDAANNQDTFAQFIIDYTAENLGFALANFAAFSNPKAYVLFGGIAQSGATFLEKVKHEMERNMLTIYQNKVEVLLSELHNSNAAVLGAAALAFQEIS